MPSNLERKKSKFNCQGIDLVHPPDVQPDGYYPYLKNVRSVTAGTVECRPGYSRVNAIPLNGGAPVHTIRRMNNTTPGIAFTPVQLFVGCGTGLFAGVENSPFVPIASGFSGEPLSTVIFRPEQSPEPWIYIADQNKLVKANNEQVVRNIGIAPPTVAPTPEITSIGGVEGVTNNGVVADGNSNTGWAGTGTAGPVAVNARVPVGTKVSDIIYDTGVNGWCCMSPENIPGDYGWLQKGARLVITGIGGPETVTVDEVIADIPDTTIGAIIYDTGVTGYCSVSLLVQTPQLSRNSIILLGVTSIVRVLSVTVGPDGLSSFRCFCPQTHAAGEAVRSVLSFRTYTTISIPNTLGIPTTLTTITGGALETGVTVGTGNITLTTALDLSTFAFTNGDNRPIQPDDYMHVSFRFNLPSKITSFRILLDVDPVTNNFTQNYYYKGFTPADLVSTVDGTIVGSGGTSQWSEMLFKVADLVRIGNDQGVNLRNVAAIRVELVCTATVIMDVAAWWVGGSYGPDVQTGSPVGISYQYRYRDSRTGARSVPSPASRFQLFPNRQRVSVGVTASTDPQVDTIDVQRFDPSLALLVYVGSRPNTTGVFTDDTQSSLIAGNPAFETDVYQPWPTLSIPLSGVVNVAGTSVTRVSGDTFPLSLIPGAIIQIGEDATQVYGQPGNGDFLELTSNLGAQTGVKYAIASPVLLGQPVQVMFGPLEGPTASYIFGVGDRRNPGTLYYSIGNNFDAASNQGNIEITSPSEPLITGVVWQTLVFVASAKRVFLGTPGFGTDLKGNQTVIFTFTELTSISGCISPWGMTKGPQGVYMIGRDGIYVLNYNSGAYYSQQIYPLFPHDGEPAKAVRGFLPVRVP